MRLRRGRRAIGVKTAAVVALALPTSLHAGQLPNVVKEAPPWCLLAELDVTAPELRRDVFLGSTAESFPVEDTTYHISPRGWLDSVDDLRYDAIGQAPGGERRFGPPAHPGVWRADVVVVDGWDAVVEGIRSQADDRYGLLFGVYRRMNDNLKFGVGYKLMDFTDSFTDPTADHWLLSVVAEF